MYTGYTESAEKIAERKARILKGYEPTKQTNMTGGNPTPTPQKQQS